MQQWIRYSLLMACVLAPLGMGSEAMAASSTKGRTQAEQGKTAKEGKKGSPWLSQHKGKVATVGG